LKASVRSVEEWRPRVPQHNGTLHIYRMSLALWNERLRMPRRILILFASLLIYHVRSATGQHHTVHPRKRDETYSPRYAQRKNCCSGTSGALRN
jgi:hypothetical protein